MGDEAERVGGEERGSASLQLQPTAGAALALGVGEAGNARVSNLGKMHCWLPCCTSRWRRAHRLLGSGGGGGH